MDPSQALIDQPVPDSVVPVDDLARAGAKGKPVPGLRGHFLTKNDQEVIGSQMPPCTGFRSGSVLCRRDEIEPGCAGSQRQVFGSEFAAARADGVDMAIPTVPGRPASYRPHRWEAHTRQGAPPSRVCRTNAPAELPVPSHH